MWAGEEHTACIVPGTTMAGPNRVLDKDGRKRMPSIAKPQGRGVKTFGW